MRHAGLLRALLVATLSWAQWVTAADIRLPDIADPSASVFSPALDERIGRAFLRQLQKEAPLIREPELESYLRSLGFRLVAHSSEPSRPFRFFFLNNPQINAFAGPGGNVGVHSGLLMTTRTESEFASVLAHEISHVTQRHLPRAFEQAKRMSLPTMAAMLGAIIIGSQGGGDAGLATATAVQAAAVQMQIDFTRHNEREADREGISILATAGFDPRAMPDFFQRMHQATRFAQGNDIPAYLKTHPVTLDRISDSSHRADQYPKSQHGSSPHYFLVKEQLRVKVARDTRELIHYYQDALRSDTREYEPALRYGLANAFLNNGEWEPAGREIQQLRQQFPDELFYVFTQARLYLATGRHENAEQLLRDKLSLHPGNQTLSLLYADTLLRLNRADQARKLLHGLIRNQAEVHADTYQLLAKAADLTGDPVQAALMEAEYQLAQGELDQAIRLLRAAGNKPNLSFIQISRIEERMRELEEERKTEQEYFR